MVAYVVVKVTRVWSIALENRSISELIHQARWVRIDPRFNPKLALIGVCGTEFNLWLNFNPGLAPIEVLRNGALLADLI